MSDNTVAIYTTIVGLVINGIGLAFVAIQVVLARQQIRRNQELSVRETTRIKRQATIDFYMSTLQRVSEWRTILPNDWDKSEIDRYINKVYGRRGEDQRKILASYLSHFEALAVAVNSGIYDLEVMDAVAGTRIMHISQNYRPFFVRRRKEVAADSAYRYLEWLGDEIRETRKRRGSTNILSR
jgi:hypothetical protein